MGDLIIASDNHLALVTEKLGERVQPVTLDVSLSGTGAPATLTHEPTWDDTDKVTILQLDASELPSTLALVRWRMVAFWTDADGIEKTEVEWFDLVPEDAEHYGSFFNAATRLPVKLPVSTTEATPTLYDVWTELVAESAVIDARLRADGFTVPVIEDDAVRLLDRATELFASANILERLIIGRSPDAAKVETAQVWRRKGESIIDALVSGQASTSATSGTGAGVSNADLVTFADACDA